MSDVPQDLWHAKMRMAVNLIKRHRDYKSAMFELGVLFSGFYQGAFIELKCGLHVICRFGGWQMVVEHDAVHCFRRFNHLGLRRLLHRCVPPLHGVLTVLQAIVTLLTNQLEFVSLKMPLVVPSSKSVQMLGQASFPGQRHWPI